MLFPLTCFSKAYWSLSGEKSGQLLPIKAFSANEWIYISPAPKIYVAQYFNRSLKTNTRLLCKHSIVT